MSSGRTSSRSPTWSTPVSSYVASWVMTSSSAEAPVSGATPIKGLFFSSIFSCDNFTGIDAFSPLLAMDDSKSLRITGGSSRKARLRNSISVSTSAVAIVSDSVASRIKSDPRTPQTAVGVLTLNSDRLKSSSFTTRNRAFPRAIWKKEERLFFFFS